MFIEKMLFGWEKKGEKTFLFSPEITNLFYFIFCATLSSLICLFRLFQILFFQIIDDS